MKPLQQLNYTNPWPSIHLQAIWRGSSRYLHVCCSSCPWLGVVPLLTRSRLTDRPTWVQSVCAVFLSTLTCLYSQHCSSLFSCWVTRARGSAQTRPLHEVGHLTYRNMPRQCLHTQVTIFGKKYHFSIQAAWFTYVQYHDLLTHCMYQIFGYVYEKISDLGEDMY